MPKVWLDVTAPLLIDSASGAQKSLQAECVRMAIQLPQGYFAFCMLNAWGGFTSIDAASAVRSLETAAAVPAVTGLRAREKSLIAHLPGPLQAPVMAVARAGAQLLRGAPAKTRSEPEAPAAKAIFAPEDVHVCFDARADAAAANIPGHRVLTPGQSGTSGAKAIDRWAQLQLQKHADAPQMIRTALVAASQGHTGFEDRLQHLYMSLLRVGDACIDIGAHTGRHALPMSCVVGRQGSVTAFEPSPAIVKLLHGRLASLDVHNVTVQETALSDEIGTAEFVIAVDLPEESGLKQRTTYNGPTRTEQVTVQLNRLDAMALPAPRFIKIDTEGAEYKVLLGARDMIGRCRPVIAFEFGQASYAAYDVDPREVFRFFDALGYDVLSIHGEPLGEAQFAEASVDQAFWDYVACDRAETERVAAILRGFPQ